MSKSRKHRRHFLDQTEIMRGVRKPMPPPTKVINPKESDHWDWRTAIEEEEDYGDTDQMPEL